MSCDFGRAMRRISLVATAWISKMGEAIHCMIPSASARFSGDPLRIGMINVDRVGIEVPLSRQEGI
jgi:hypothetical protein